MGTTIATILITEGMPDDQYVSAKKSIYYNNKTKKYMLDNAVGCQKEVVTYYSKKNFSGKSTKGTQYYWTVV